MSFPFSLDFVAHATNGTVVQRRQEEFSGVGTDTRTDLSNKIFVALRGANFDAHKFLSEAVDKGAKLLVVDSIDEKQIGELSQVSILKVTDTLGALQNLASAWRKKFKAKVVGITGSNGKTTTKEFAATLLKSKFKTYASPASFNNHWGVPLSLLAVDQGMEIAIIEMGMNHMGEIARLCEIARPDVALVTTVGSAHIGELGSQKAIAQAKEEIYNSSPKAIPIFNLDNQWTIEMHQRAKQKGQAGKSITFSSFDTQCDVSFRVEKMEFGSVVLSGYIRSVEGKVHVPVFGRHNCNNLMAASGVALACGMTPEEIWEALPECRGVWGRSQLVELNSGAKVLFDAYNANFESMSALVKNVFEFDLKGKKIAIIGQMLELGNESAQLHEQLGELMARTGFSVIWFLGVDKSAFERGLQRGGFNKNLFLSDTYEESLALKLGSMLNQSDIAIIKGSRGMKLEQVLEAWQAQSF